MVFRTFVASQCGARLDSNVLTGGGTDDTAAIQGILDMASDPETGVRLIMDGAALITGLSVYSNTIIECRNPACGFYLADHSDCSIVVNAHQTKTADAQSEPLHFGMIEDENISLIGGTYNHNCQNQAHDKPRPNSEHVDFTVTFWFEGVRNLTLRDLTIRDQRTFAALITNWENVNVENVRIDLPHKEHAENQDGLHFFGPGRILNIRNLSGNAGDDFLALAPDEADQCSSITDVNIDGVHLEDADQGIRMLVRNKGRLDRVNIKNVTGTYRSFGFFIQPFFDDGVDPDGGFGDIIIDTVNLHQNGVDYHYTTPFLFRLGGNFDHITLRNIYSIKPIDARSLLDIGWQAGDDSHVTEETATKIGTLLIDGLHVYQTEAACGDMSFIKIKKSRINHFTIRNTEIVRQDSVPAKGQLIQLFDGVNIGTLYLNGVLVQRVAKLLAGDKESIARRIEHNVEWL